MKKILLIILFLFFFQFSSSVFAIPGGVQGTIYYVLPDGTQGPLPGVKISRMDHWHWGENYCASVPDEFKGPESNMCWGYFSTVETTSDNNGVYKMDNDNNNPPPLAAKIEEGVLITRCMIGERRKVSVCRVTPTGPMIEGTSYLYCPDPGQSGYIPNQLACLDPPISCLQLNWCGFSCGYGNHRWGPYFPEGYRLPGNLENLGYSHLRGRWYRYKDPSQNFKEKVPEDEYIRQIGNSYIAYNHDFFFYLDPPLTPTPYLVIRVKDTKGNPRLAEKMALTYSCTQDSFCKASQEVTLQSEQTFPYSGGRNKGGGIVPRSFHKLLGVTPVPNTGGRLDSISVPCNGINCPETWQNYWWDNFPNTGKVSLDYVVYVYPTPSLGNLIIKAEDTQDSASGQYGFSGMRIEESSVSREGIKLGRNQYNYMVVGQVINSNISSSQNFNLDPKANIGLGGVIFGPRGGVQYNPYNLNDPGSILSIVRSSRGFIMLYAEKAISRNARKHLLTSGNFSNFQEIKNDYFYFYLPTNENFTAYHWVEMPNDIRLFYEISSDDKKIFKVAVSAPEMCYDAIDQKTSVPCFRVYLYSGFLSHQQKKVYEWGTYGYVYDHLRDKNFMDYKNPSEN